MENDQLDMPSEIAWNRANDLRETAEQHLAIDLNAAIANTRDGHKLLSLDPYECLVHDDGSCEFGLRVNCETVDRVAIAALVMEWAKNLAKGN